LKRKSYYNGFNYFLTGEGELLISAPHPPTPLPQERGQGGEVNATT